MQHGSPAAALHPGLVRWLCVQCAVRQRQLISFPSPNPRQPPLNLHRHRSSPPLCCCASKKPSRRVARLLSPSLSSPRKGRAIPTSLSNISLGLRQLDSRLPSGEVSSSSRLRLCALVLFFSAPSPADHQSRPSAFVYLDLSKTRPTLNEETALWLCDRGGRRR